MVAARSRRSATRRGYLELDDAPPETDDRRMRPVVGVEFRKNALDSPFDSVFRNAELICYCLLAFPSAIRRNTTASAGVSA